MTTLLSLKTRHSWRTVAFSKSWYGETGTKIFLKNAHTEKRGMFRTKPSTQNTETSGQLVKTKTQKKKEGCVRSKMFEQNDDLGTPEEHSPSLRAGVIEDFSFLDFPLFLEKKKRKKRE